jgi:hypothetical protein
MKLKNNKLQEMMKKYHYLPVFLGKSISKNKVSLATIIQILIKQIQIEETWHYFNLKNKCILVMACTIISLRVNLNFTQLILQFRMLPTQMINKTSFIFRKIFWKVQGVHAKLVFLVLMIKMMSIKSFWKNNIKKS